MNAHRSPTPAVGQVWMLRQLGLRLRVIEVAQGLVTLERCGETKQCSTPWLRRECRIVRGAA